MINSNQATIESNKLMKNTNYGIVKTFNEYDFINEFEAYNPPRQL